MGINKEEYLKIHSIIFDKQQEIRKCYIESIPDFKIREDTTFSNFVIDGWIREINNLIFETNFVIKRALIYNEVMKEQNAYWLELYRDVNLKTALNNIYSFKDKICFLFKALIGMHIYVVDKCKITETEIPETRLDFKKFFKYIQAIKREHLPAKMNITEKDLIYIKQYFYKLNAIKSKIFNYRNTNTHRWEIGIDSCGSGVISVRTIKKKPLKLLSSSSSNITNGSNYNEETSILKECNDILNSFSEAEEIIKISITTDNLNFDQLIKEIENILNQYNELNKEIFNSLLNTNFITKENDA